MHWLARGLFYAGMRRGAGPRGAAPCPMLPPTRTPSCRNRALDPLTGWLRDAPSHPRASRCWQSRPASLHGRLPGMPPAHRPPGRTRHRRRAWPRSSMFRIELDLLSAEPRRIVAALQDAVIHPANEGVRGLDRLHPPNTCGQHGNAGERDRKGKFQREPFGCSSWALVLWMSLSTRAPPRCGSSP